jgi:uncharacterized protein YsxB (DUF464 family)
MTTITVEHDPDGDVCTLKAHGHAGYADHGEDIVCAAISALMITAARAAEALGGTVVADENAGAIEVSLTPCMDAKAYEDASMILAAIADGLIAIEENYAQYMNIVEV